MNLALKILGVALSVAGILIAAPDAEARPREKILL